MTDTLAPLRAPARVEPETPYVGLVPYAESDAAFFFGRDDVKEIVAGNLQASRLTIVYGASGVGKSSVLHAGVVHDLHAQMRENAEPGDERTPFAVCAFSTWREAPLPALLETMRTAALEALGRDELTPWRPGEPVVAAVRAWTARVHPLMVVLDQFEDYFLYHPDETGEGTFAAAFPQLVNQPDLHVNFVLSLREDAWARLDRFEESIPSLFANYVRVEHLSRAAARLAIEGPIERWNERLAEGEEPYSVDRALTDAVVEAAGAGRLAFTDAAGGAVPEAATADAVEAPFLQLVLDRLWRATVDAGAHRLDLARLQSLGGAEQIVRSHLLEALARLTPAEQAVAAELFRYLVTRSRTKIARPASDLAEWTKRPETEVEAVLEKLCRGESGRILRSVSPPLGETAASYELFHDILAEPIIAWRQQYEERREREAAELRQREQRRRYVLASGVAIALASVFLGLAILAVVEQRHADGQRRRADGLLRVQQDSNRALRARIAKDFRNVKESQAANDAVARSVVELRATNRTLTEQTARLKKTRDALAVQNGALRRTNRTLAGEIDTLNAQNASLAKQINSLDDEYVSLERQSEQLAADTGSLQANGATLGAEIRALEAESAAVGKEYDALTRKADELGLPRILAPHAVTKAEPQLPPRARPVVAARFRIPGDVAGSDALRRKVEELEARLQALLEQRARQVDEAGWLRQANDVLTQQRTALRGATAQLRSTRSGLERRERALRDTRARADAEHRRLTAADASRRMRNTRARSANERVRTANGRLQTRNNDRVWQIDDLQRSIAEGRAKNASLAALIAPHVDRLVQSARAEHDPKIAALLAVDAYRVAPYDPDDPAHPAVYDALWLALGRLDPKAAQQLTAGPRSAAVRAGLCALLPGPPTAAQQSRLRGYLPETARPTLLKPCG